MTRIALWMIAFYQRFISPHKGYSCAYSAHTGRASCSAFGYRAIRRLGLIGGIVALRARFRRCSMEYYKALDRGCRGVRNAGATRHQAGFIDLDLPVVDCDVGHHDCDVCDPSDCCSIDVSPCDGDWGSSRRKRHEGRRG